MGSIDDPPDEFKEKDGGEDAGKEPEYESDIYIFYNVVNDPKWYVHSKGL